MKMKVAAFAITLLMSGAAVAQSAPDTFTPAPGTTAIMPVLDSAAPDGIGTVAVTTPASGKVVQPDNANPRRDSNDIAVRSEPAIVPDGWNGVSGTLAMGGPLGDAANVETVPTISGVPACSATVTDHCRERYRQDFTGR